MKLSCLSQTPTPSSSLPLLFQEYFVLVYRCHCFLLSLVSLCVSPVGCLCDRRFLPLLPGLLPCLLICLLTGLPACLPVSLLVLVCLRDRRLVCPCLLAYLPTCLPVLSCLLLLLLPLCLLTCSLTYLPTCSV